MPRSQTLENSSQLVWYESWVFFHFGIQRNDYRKRILKLNKLKKKFLTGMKKIKQAKGRKPLCREPLFLKR